VILVDASVLLSAEDADDAHHQDAVALLRSGLPLATVDLAVLEVTNIADTQWRDAEAGERLRERIWAIAAYGRLVRVDHALGRTLARLAREHRLSAYDAAYLAAAERVDATLASCDERDLVGPGLARLPGDCLPKAAEDGDADEGDGNNAQ
jgi:predicted nucleic acid-binding protein